MRQAFESLIGACDEQDLAQVRAQIMERFVAGARSRDRAILLWAWKETDVYARKLISGQLI